MHNGNVYIIEKNNNFIKIGRSKTPDKRIKQVETQGGFTAINYFISPTCSNYRAMELKMHKVLSRYRNIGEWFNFGFEEAVEILKSQEYNKPLTEEEINRRSKEQIDIIAGATGIGSVENILEENPLEESEDYYHCEYCSCPKSEWEALETYKSDMSCKLFNDFLDVIWDLEETKEKYSRIKIYKQCTQYEKEYPDIVNFNETINEMIEIGLDTGVVTRYVRLNAISSKI